MATKNLQLKEMMESQGSKYVTFNEALWRLDAVVQANVISQQNEPSASPNEGDKYIVVSASASSPWAGQTGNIAQYYQSQWIFITPTDGWHVYDNNQHQLYAYKSATNEWVINTGGIHIHTEYVSANYSATVSDIAKTIGVDTGSGDIDFYLPNPTDIRDGFVIGVFKTSPDGNSVHIHATSATIQGVASVVADDQWDAYTLAFSSSKSDWIVTWRNATLYGIASSVFTNQGQMLVSEASGVVSVLSRGTPGQVLRITANGSTIEWANVSGTGDVVGPASSTNGGIPFFNGSTGKAILSSNWQIISSTTISGNGGLLKDVVISSAVIVSALVSGIHLSEASITNPSITSGVIDGTEIRSYKELVTSVNISGGQTSVNLSMASSQVFHVVLQANATVRFTDVPAVLLAGNMTLFVDQDGTGGRSMTVLNAVYASGAVSTVSQGAGEKDLWTFVTFDNGSTMYAMAGGRKFQ